MALSATRSELDDVRSDSDLKLKKEEMFASAKKLFLPGEAQVFQDGENLLIRLNGLSFLTGKGSLPAESSALLKKLGTVVADFGPSRVRIEGHTDSRGSLATNARLSSQRALIVRDYLVSKQIISQDEIVTQGLGEVGPLATNKTALGRAQNRRVDVIVQPTQTSR